jgi:hypothetical protein
MRNCASGNPEILGAQSRILGFDASHRAGMTARNTDASEFMTKQD